MDHKDSHNEGKKEIARLRDTQDRWADKKINNNDYLEARRRMFKEAKDNDFKAEEQPEITAQRATDKGDRWGRALGEILYDPAQRREVMGMLNFLAKDPREAMGDFPAELPTIPDADTDEEHRRAFILQMIDERGERAMYLFQRGISKYLHNVGTTPAEFARRQMWWTETFGLLQAARSAIETQEIPDPPDHLLRLHPERRNDFTEGFVNALNEEANKYSPPEKREDSGWVVPFNAEEKQQEKQLREDYLRMIGTAQGKQMAEKLYCEDGQKYMDLATKALDRAWQQDEPTLQTKAKEWLEANPNGRRTPNWLRELKLGLRDWLKLEEASEVRFKKFVAVITRYEAVGKSIVDYDRDLRGKVLSAIEDIKSENKEEANPTVALEEYEKMEDKLKEVAPVKRYELASDERNKLMEDALVNKPQIEEGCFVAGLPWDADWGVYNEGFREGFLAQKEDYNRRKARRATRGAPRIAQPARVAV